MDDLEVIVHDPDGAEARFRLDATASVSDCLSRVAVAPPRDGWKYIGIENSWEVLLPSDSFAATYAPGNIYLVRNEPLFPFTRADIERVRPLFDRDADLALSYCETFFYAANSVDFESFLATESRGSAFPWRCNKTLPESSITVHCRDCALTDDSVICLECFRGEDHDGHHCETRYGGTCSCGNFLKWKEQSCCPDHTSRKTCHSDTQSKNYKFLLAFFSMILATASDKPKLWERVIPWLIRLMNAGHLYVDCLAARIMAGDGILANIIKSALRAPAEWIHDACTFLCVLLEVQVLPPELWVGDDDPPPQVFKHYFTSTVEGLFGEIMEQCEERLREPPGRLTEFVRLLMRVFTPDYAMEDKISDFAWFDFFEEHFTRLVDIAASNDALQFENCAYEEICTSFTHILRCVGSGSVDDVLGVVGRSLDDFEGVGIPVSRCESSPGLVFAQKAVTRYVDIFRDGISDEAFKGHLKLPGPGFDPDRAVLNLSDLPFWLTAHVVAGHVNAADFGEFPEHAIVYPARVFALFYLFSLGALASRPWLCELFHGWQKAGLVRLTLPPLFRILRAAFFALDREFAVDRLAHIFNLFLPTLSAEAYAASSFAFWFLLATLIDAPDVPKDDVLADTLELRLALDPLRPKQAVVAALDSGTATCESEVRSALRMIARPAEKDRSALTSRRRIDSTSDRVELFRPYIDCFDHWRCRWDWTLLG
jgi:hypothetical protein